MARLKINPLSFTIATVSIVIANLILIYKIGIVELDSAPDAIIFPAVFGVLLFALFKGYNWSRLLLVVLSVMATILFVMAGTMDDDYEFLLVALGYAVAIPFLIKSGNRPVNLNPLAQLKSNVGAFKSQDVEYKYPSLVVRYKALLVDGALIITLMIVTMILLEDSEYRAPIMIAMGSLGVLVYDPLLTCYSATIGQKVMKIRVRRFDDPHKKLRLGHAYARALVKALLGWVSFLTINFNAEHRAIHDFAGNSVMVKDEKVSLQSEDIS